MAEKNIGVVEDAADTPDSDEQLIRQLRAGNTQAYAVLYERHIAAAKATATRHASNSSDVADLVAEAFANVLDAIQSGNGPTVFFRAYLLTTLRRLASVKRVADGKQVAVDDLETVIAAEPGRDPAVAAFEKDVVGRSFKGLPERWQAVLWYTEVDGLAPAEISPMLGITPNAVAALAVRAREGLKQAYLQNHVSAATGSCADYANNLGAYARGALTRRRKAKLELHLQGCLRCSEMLLHVEDVGVGMRTIIFPAVVGMVFVGAKTSVGAVLGAVPLLGESAPAAGFGGGGLGGAGATALGSAGLSTVVAASAVGIALVGAVVASAVVLPNFQMRGAAVEPHQIGSTFTAPAAQTQRPPAGTPSPGAIQPFAAAPSAAPYDHAELFISTVPPDPDRPLAETDGLIRVPLPSKPAPVQSTPVQPTPRPSTQHATAAPSLAVRPAPEPTATATLPMPTSQPSPTQPPSATAVPSNQPSNVPTPTPTPTPAQTPTATAVPSNQPSNVPTPVPSQEATPEPSPPSTSVPTTTPELTATATPDAGVNFSIRGSLLSQTALETLFQLEISSTGADLAGPQVWFSVPRLWMGIPVEVTPPAGWSCASTSTLLSAGATCSAANWAGTVGTFMVRVPTPGILHGYPVKISVAASGAESFNGWIWFK